jgi:putative SOS response-associated peptidase YedK
VNNPDIGPAPVMNRYVGNLPPMPGVFPDYRAPVVRNVSNDRELTMMRWGMPPPPRTGGWPVTNIRNTSSPHWRGWLKPKALQRPLPIMRSWCMARTRKTGLRFKKNGPR